MRDTGTGAGTRPPSDTVEEAYRRLRPTLLRLAHLLTGSPEAAEDVVHDAFLACSTRWSTLDSPEAYLRRAVVNQARSALRRSGRDRDKVARYGHAAVVTVGEPELDGTWALLRGLPGRQRAALVLRFYEDLPEAEIARLLGCRPGTVKSLIHRGLEKVRKEVLR